MVPSNRFRLDRFRRFFYHFRTLVRRRRWHLGCTTTGHPNFVEGTNRVDHFAAEVSVAGFGAASRYRTIIRRTARRPHRQYFGFVLAGPNGRVTLFRRVTWFRIKSRGTYDEDASRPSNNVPRGVTEGANVLLHAAEMGRLARPIPTVYFGCHVAVLPYDGTQPGHSYC